MDFAAGVPTLSLPSLHRFGLIDDLELRLETPILGVDTTGAASRQDVALALKWNMEKLGLPGWLPPLALLGTGSLTAANSVEPALNLLTDIELPLEVGLNANLGSILPTGGSPNMTYALSFSRDIVGPWQVYAELAGQVDPAGAGTAHGVDGGFMAFLGDDSKLMAAVQTDIAQPFGTWYITTNFSHRFGSY